MTQWMKKIMLLVAIAALAVTALYAEQLYRGQLADQRQLDNSALLRSELRRLPSLAEAAGSGDTQQVEQLTASESALYSSWGRLYKQLHSEMAGQGAAPPAILNRFAEQLTALRGELAEAFAKRTAAQQWRHLAERSAEALPLLEQQLAQEVEQLVAAGAQSATVLLAQQQLWRLQKLDRAIVEIARAPQLSEANVSALIAAANQISEALQALSSLGRGSSELGVATEQFSIVSEALRSFEQNLPEFLALHAALNRAVSFQQPLLDQLELIEQQIRRRAAQPLWQRAAPPLRWAAATALLALLAYLLLNWRSAVLLHRVERHLQDEQQAELEQLITELSAIGEGDLTRQLSAETETAAVLASSINSAVEALRRLVAGAARQSEQLGVQSESHQRVSQQLAEGASSQLEQLAVASTTLADLAKLVEATARRAEQSRQAAEEARDTATLGVERVAESSLSICKIDAAMAAAAESLAALRAGAQQVDKVAAVITDVADQTKILALNAAIQATGSGSEARGFAVVADEIQRLAESAANAAGEIGALIAEVQSHSVDADTAVQQSCSELASGKQRIAAAGDALTAIERGAQQLMPLIAEISSASSRQAEQAKEIAGGVKEVEQQAAATLARSRANAEGTAQLAELSVEMRRSISHFTLGELAIVIEPQQPAEPEPENPLEVFEREIEQLLANAPKPGSERE